MQSMKETAANVAASAKAGIGKTKAVLQEKVEKMSTHDPLQKEMATEKKEQRIAEAEWNKQEAREHNAAAKQSGGHGGYTTTGTGAYGSTGSGPGSGAGTYGSTGYGGGEPHAYSAAGQPGYPMGGQQMSAMPGHGTGTQYGGMVDDGAVRTHPSGLAGETTGHNPSVVGTGLGPGGDMPRYGNRTGDAAPDYSRTGGIRDEYS